jgi:hypothetical protein
MDEKKESPLLFADKVVHKFVDNLLGRSIDGKQLGAIRVVFRRCGGEWSSILAGDPVHIGLLIRLVQTWGNLNEKKDAA